MATEAEIKKMKRGELNELAVEYGLNPDEYRRADDLRSAIFDYLHTQRQESQETEREAEESKSEEETAESVKEEPKTKPNPPRSRIERRGKRYRAAHQQIETSNFYSLDEAVELIPVISNVKFDEAVELHVSLGVDTQQADQLVRGTVVLPHGSGKARTVAVLVPEGKQKETEQAGADMAGYQDILDKISQGDIEFDVLVAHSDVMKDLSQYAKVLGPKGLMPNPKAGTVTDRISDTVKELKGGRVEYRVDRYGHIHQAVGRASFPPEHLTENIRALMQSVLQARPGSLKSAYLQKAHLTTTMGPSIKLDISTLT